MAVSSVNRIAGPYAGNGATAAFPFEFKVFQASEVYVETQDEDGGETVLVLGSDYLITLNTDQDTDPGGTITLNAPLANGLRLTATSQVLPTQDTTLTNFGGFYPRVLNAVFDKIVIMVQQALVDLDRSVRAPLGESGIRLPRQALRTRKIPVFDDDGEFDLRSLDEFDDNVAQVNTNAVAIQNTRTIVENLAGEVSTNKTDTLLAMQATQEIYAEATERYGDISIATMAARDETLEYRNEVNALYQNEIVPLPDRVTALENPFTISLTASPSSFELGTAQVVTLTRTFNQTLVSAEIDQGVGDLANLNAGTVGSISGGSIDETTTYTLTASNGYTSKTTAVTVSVLPRMFWGAHSSDDLADETAAEIRAALLSSSALASNANRSLTIATTGAQFIYVAVPADFTLSRLTAWGFDELENCEISDVDINDAGGAAQPYKLIRLPNAVTGPVEVQIYA